MNLGQLAREACDAETDRRGRATYSFDDHGLKRFAALMVEELAADWERSHGFDKHGVGAFIRAMIKEGE